MGANREAGAGAGCEVLQAEGADVNANALGRDFRFGRGIRVHCRFAMFVKYRKICPNQSQYVGTFCSRVTILTCRTIYMS